MTTSTKGYSLNVAMYPTMMSYSPDGYGRDKYIHYDNGGFFKDNNQSISIVNKYDVPKYRNYHSLKKNVAPLKYHSDGSGRDTYVIYNSGGLEKDYTPLKHLNLKKFLRTPDSGTFNFKASPMREGVSAKTLYVSKQELTINQNIKKLEKGLLHRLYYSEQHKFSPKNSKANTLRSSNITLPPILESTSEIPQLSATPQTLFSKKLMDINNQNSFKSSKNNFKIQYTQS